MVSNMGDFGNYAIAVIIANSALRLRKRKGRANSPVKYSGSRDNAASAALEIQYDHQL
jgi:hypothetical protein